MEENKKRKGDNCGSNMIYWKKWCDRVATTIEIPSTSTVATDHISPSKSVIEAESVSDSKDEPHVIAAKLDIASTKRDLRFQLSWINRFPWITYSEVNTGAFCRICVIMGRSKKEVISINSELADNFFKVMSLKTLSVVDQINSEKKRQQEENKSKLTSIVKAIILCGKQGIPLRGKSDSGRIQTSSEPKESLLNEDNFRAILKYGAESGDKILSEHLLNASNNAFYTSPQIQNEIIEICGAAIQEVIIKEVKKANFLPF
ncbi:hypothetical protein HELRODRAFT_182815 [Helobdella robusta]|uniref:Uncharacterized protein n=1 Tax=Helobdella robusta TaxID=6412 RepID=T1FIS7_HELRO|nr:hypothetical protein HELRODRAFT_182815 [Helobdella robusta]ESN90119.1 hypothetical protein HELRODRAFT_182815 [Helobdella robusta]